MDTIHNRTGLKLNTPLNNQQHGYGKRPTYMAGWFSRVESKHEVC